MRLKNVPGSKEAIEASYYVVKNPTEHKGKWNLLFKNNNPTHIEVGMGKGQFLNSLAELNPNVNFVGIEKFSSVLIRAVEKVEKTQLKNLLYIRMDAEELTEVFEKEEIDKIYLNFSDPWPKDRHAKRRLTSTQFFERYEKILKRDGVVEFKTDNRLLFDFSLEQVPAAGWKLKAYTFNLHQDTEMNEGNIMTEYEEKFSAKGNPIHKLIAFR